jgi:hypothetical protein
MFVLGVMLLPSGLKAAPSICDTDTGNLVANCGFETGDFTSWASSGWNVDTEFNGVTANSGTFYAWTGCGEDSCIAPDSDPDGAWFYQDLATTVGGTYDLTFFYNPSSPGPAELQVLWGDSATPLVASANGTCSVGTSCVFDNRQDDPTNAYTEFTVDGLVATSGSTRLEFLGEQEPLESGVDDIMVDGASPASGVPEPGSLVLMGAGLIGLVGYRFKGRKNSAA